ncbi:hypothetical protein AB0H43_38765 [Hamadaea sp. NPDC050747]|uniref:hypothetical protein n=1 Tax=Hamadaea sp. NPDC050747 TaxID=3155789 RepID=UPI00340A44A6
MTMLDEAAQRSRARLRRTAVGFVGLWCVALTAFASINLRTGLQARPYLLHNGSDAGDRFATNFTMVSSWLGLVASVGLATWVTSLVVMTRTTQMHSVLRTRVRVASAVVLVSTPFVTVGTLVVAYQMIVPVIYSGVRF